jgi:hypothetical protein
MQTIQRLTMRAPDPRKNTETMVVGLLLRSVRVFRQVAWLEAGSGKMAFSRLAHQRVTRAVNCNDIRYTFLRLESSKLRLKLAISDGLNM